ncbi:MAG: hypothetical protein K5871_08895 [Lachnospiraceae bacterium]|nr:hypothetical protein [Lachnospiraceae bacterium]
MEEKIGQIIKRFCWVPLAFGMIGYYIVGKMSFFEALYASCALYFVNPAADVDNIWVMISKLTALIVAAGVVLSFLRSVYRTLDRAVMYFFSDSTAVYTDNEIGERLEEKLKHGFFGRIEKRKSAEKAKYHIIFLEDDPKTLQFFEERKNTFGKSVVYLLVREMDPFLLNAIDMPGVRIVNIYEVMARKFWKQYNLYDVRKIREYSVAIVGYGNVGRAIFRYGYLNNIFSLDQRITYHIWGCNESDKVFLKSLIMMNDDRVVVHDEKWEDDLDEIAKADRVIISQEDDAMQIAQEVIYRDQSTEVFYYNAEGRKWGGFYAAGKLIRFGYLEEYLTEEDIKEERLYSLGKLFNYDYGLRYGGKPENTFNELDVNSEWDKIDGFKKASSVARGDHYWIEKQIREDGEFYEEEFWEIEHIRWSRFHYINHWTYDDTRDNAKRKHNLLVPFEDLDQTEKEKDGVYGSVVRDKIDKLVEKEKAALGKATAD